MGKIYQSAAELIVGTPLLQVSHFAKEVGAENATILAKLEYLTCGQCKRQSWILDDKGCGGERTFKARCNVY